MLKRMPTEKVVYTSGGSSLLTAIAIVFVILKLTWCWLLAPLWLPVVFAIGIVLVLLLILLIVAAIAACSK